ncbi:MAG: response regulator [Candidatus Hydrogenedentota bacterium]
MRHLMEHALERYGYTLLSAPGGPEALDSVSSHSGPIDLLITDAIMPYISGYEVAEVLQERCPEVKVVYVSGYPKKILSQHGVLIPGP